MFDFLCYRDSGMYCGNWIFVNWIQDKLKFFQPSNQKNMAQNLISNIQSLILPFLSQKNPTEGAVLLNSQLFQN